MKATKSEQLHIRVTPKIKKIVVRQAKKLKLSQGEFIEYLVQKERNATN